MPEKLVDTDYNTAARMLKCEVAAIKAVASVESSGDGFLPDGRVKVLFEGHQFYKYTKGAFATTHPTLCYPKWTRQFYANTGAGEYARFEQAIALNRTAALLSASYGKFQVMGFNFAICSFINVEDFFSAMQKSEADQLDAFCNYIKSNCLTDELTNLQWDKFACKYNGPEYRKNSYDAKLAKAYNQYRVV